MKAWILILGLAPGAVAQDDLAGKLKGVYTGAGDWLVSQQDGSGAWKMGPPGQAMPSPAYTAIIVTSLAGAPEGIREKYAETVKKGVSFLLSKTNEDGSFGEGPSGSFMKTYTTAVALMALSSVERSDRIGDAIRGAQAYLKRNQLTEGVQRGALGYGDEEPKVVDGQLQIVKKTIGNLSVTGFGAEGMKRSGLPQDDEFWTLVVQFVRKCQNSSEVNNDPAFVAALQEQGLSVGEDGSLYYTASTDRKVHKAGTVKISDKETIVGYGSMTYEGIKTYLYAGLAKDSPEVTAAADWVRKNYSLDAHPGFSFDAAQRHHLRGLYYYYLVMAKGLDAYGETPFTTFDGAKHDWPREMAERLVATAKESKMWVNENPAWYEGDPVLVTSYVLNICDVLFKYVK